MHRVSSISAAGTWNAATAIDRVTLDADDRTRRRIVLTGEKGTQVLIDFDKPVTLRDGDGLVLEDGSIVLVAGMAEPLAEIDGFLAARIRAARLASRQSSYRRADRRASHPHPPRPRAGGDAARARRAR